MSNYQPTDSRVSRTRKFFRWGCYDLDPSVVFSHILVCACDDEDVRDDKSFTALDIYDVFSSFRAFVREVNDGVHYFVEHPEFTSITRLVGFIYINKVGKVEFVPEYELGRCDWVTTLHMNGAGTALRVMAECTGGCRVELYN